MSRALSPREKNLALIVAVAFFLFANFLLIDWGWKRYTRLKTEVANHSKQLRLLDSMTADLAFWEQRDAWLQANQPKLENRDTAGVQLLDVVKELARKHGVLLENPAIRLPEEQANAISISIELETKSAWKPLVDFLRDLQTPEHFIAIESANLKIDTADATQMRGRFRIAKWYAPH